MKMLTKLALGLVGVGAATAATVLVRRYAAKRSQQLPDLTDEVVVIVDEVGGTMLIGELTELEISSRAAQEGYDPETIPSAHDEIDDLISNLANPNRGSY